jgi:hypothetical protein
MRSYAPVTRTQIRNTALPLRLGRLRDALVNNLSADRNPERGADALQVWALSGPLRGVTRAVVTLPADLNQLTRAAPHEVLARVDSAAAEARWALDELRLRTDVADLLGELLDPDDPARWTHAAATVVVMGVLASR